MVCASLQLQKIYEALPVTTSVKKSLLHLKLLYPVSLSHLSWLLGSLELGSMSKFAGILLACVFVVASSAILELDLDPELDLDDFDESDELEDDFDDDAFFREDRSDETCNFSIFNREHEVLPGSKNYFVSCHYFLFQLVLVALRRR